MSVGGGISRCLPRQIHCNSRGKVPQLTDASKVGRPYLTSLAELFGTT